MNQETLDTMVEMLEEALKDAKEVRKDLDMADVANITDELPNLYDFEKALERAENRINDAAERQEDIGNSLDNIRQTLEDALREVKNLKEEQTSLHIELSFTMKGNSTFDAAVIMRHMADQVQMAGQANESVLPNQIDRNRQWTVYDADSIEVGILKAARMLK